MSEQLPTARSQARQAIMDMDHADLVGLYGFAAANGRNWRAKLQAKWDGSINDCGWVRRMRNTLGPDLLREVRLAPLVFATAQRCPELFPIPDINADARVAVIRQDTLAEMENFPAR